MTNQEKQSDEILVLQSIFDTKFRLLHDKNQYEISIDFALIQPFYLRCNNKKSIIHHLPPLSLTVHYHDSYPSESAPNFFLSCFYFSKLFLQYLCRILDHYPFIKGEVCVYDWIELIRQQINDELVLDMNTDEQIYDPRVSNGYLVNDTDHIYQSLISYNDGRENKPSHNQLQTCSICIENIVKTDCIHLQRCKHFYCQSCLNHYVRAVIDNGRFHEKLVCPFKECQETLFPNEIKRILKDDQLYERYERLTLQHALELRDDIMWCPKCQSAISMGSDDDRLVICDQCQFKFCSKCREDFHIQQTCPRDYIMKQFRLQQEKQQKKDRKKMTKQRDTREVELSRIQKHQRIAAERELVKQNYREITIDLSEEDTLLEKILNAERLEAMNTQLCPKCHVRIEKNGGCPYMKCSRCDHSFCWSKTEGSEDPTIISLLHHTSSDQSVESIRDELNTTVDTAKVSEQDKIVVINNRSFIGSAILKRVKACPNVSCQKLNVKMGDDNWIVCEECLEHYCFLCAVPINGLQHFKKKCDRRS